MANKLLCSGCFQRDSEPQRIRLLSWNIDGLDQQNRESRIKAVCDLIHREKPHVIFLQEVIEPTERVIRQMCQGYHLISGQHTCRYYTSILLDKTCTSYQDASVILYPYANSRMGRNLLQVNVNVKGNKFKLMTTHLESCEENSVSRIEQLKTAFKTITSSDTDQTVVFGGDLNVRDAEVHVKGIKFKLLTSHLESCIENSVSRIEQLKTAFETITSSDTDKTVVFGGDLNVRDVEIPKANGIPDNVYDLWELTGKRPETEFTWDMNKNGNRIYEGSFKPKCRIDRLYYKDSGPKTLQPVYFELVGLERLQSCQRFASDHWGMLAHFDIV